MVQNTERAHHGILILNILRLINWKHWKEKRLLTIWITQLAAIIHNERENVDHKIITLSTSLSWSVENLG